MPAVAKIAEGPGLGQDSNSACSIEMPVIMMLSDHEAWNAKLANGMPNIAGNGKETTFQMQRNLRKVGRQLLKMGQVAKGPEGQVGWNEQVFKRSQGLYAKKELQ